MSAWLIALIIGAVVTVATVLAARAGIVPRATVWWSTLSTVSLALALYSGHFVAWLIFWAVLIAMLIAALVCRFDGGWLKLAKFGSVVLVLLSVFVTFGFPFSSENAAAVVAEPTSTASASPSASAECPAEFVQVAVDRSSGNKVDPRFNELTRPIWDDATNGVIDAATTKSRLIEQLRFMAGSNAQSLAAWAFDQALWDDANNWQPLVDGGSIVDGGCLSPEGQTLLGGYIDMLERMDVQAGTVPTWFVGAGITGDTFNYAFAPGISSDPSSFVWTKPSGEKHYQQVICGNTPRETEKPGIPKGPTEGQEEPPPTNPPATTPPATCPADKPYGTPETGCKDAPAADPAPQGNAPEGGGRNEDPGPGVYVPPPAMEQPPATPRVNPPTPPAATATPAPPVVVQPQPEPSVMPTVAPSEQPIGNGVVPTAAPPGTVCNPDFQDCP